MSTLARQIIENEQNEIYVSIASLWEISIRTALKKLEIAGSYESVLEDIIDNDMEIMSISFIHTVNQNKLPFHHRDPFDRIIACQALAEGINLLGADEIFDNYLIGDDVTRIW